MQPQQRYPVLQTLNIMAKKAMKAAAEAPKKAMKAMKAAAAAPKRAM